MPKICQRYSDRRFWPKIAVFYGICGGCTPPLSQNHCVQKNIAEWGGTPLLSEKIRQVVFDGSPFMGFWEKMGWGVWVMKKIRLRLLWLLEHLWCRAKYCTLVNVVNIPRDNLWMGRIAGGPWVPHCQLRRLRDREQTNRLELDMGHQPAKHTNPNWTSIQE